jgi:hypothetical protein
MEFNRVVGLAPPQSYTHHSKVLHSSTLQLKLFLRTATWKRTQERLSGTIHQEQQGLRPSGVAWNGKRWPHQEKTTGSGIIFLGKKTTGSILRLTIRGGGGRVSRSLMCARTFTQIASGQAHASYECNSDGRRRDGPRRRREGLEFGHDAVRSPQ